VRQQVAEAGYRLATAGSGTLSRSADPFLLPRREVLGHQTLEEFAALVAHGTRAGLGPRLRYRWLRLLRDRRTYMDW
jgi:hypothetical protein